MCYMVLEERDTLASLAPGTARKPKFEETLDAVHAVHAD